MCRAIIAGRKPTESNVMAEKKSVKFVNLALQGGGSHGAYTWGVLDRLLEEESIDIEAVSGTSAGAINAVALAHGYATGGRAGAKDALKTLWHKVAELGEGAPWLRTPWDKALKSFNLDFNPGFLAFDLMSRMLSPYQVNPFAINPLRDVLDEMIDWEAVRKTKEFKIFLSATNVRTGRVKIFEQAQLTTDMVLASTCLPLVFQAVEIDGEAYWDGGYMGNPALFPLFYSSQSRDIIIVEINPLERPGVPKTSREIIDRINEISFNGSLLQELRMVEFVTRLLDDNKLDSEKYHRMLIHMISNEDELRALGAASKFNADTDFIKHLHGIGVRTADKWLTENGGKLGKTSSVDLAKLVSG
jgi:NTE family protein